MTRRTVVLCRRYRFIVGDGMESAHMSVEENIARG
jgi:hypothetical protein